ncbi:NADH-ubiquinone oxidoreductase chain 5 [Camellia lanceoleosa]|uniref:NADH-ubiquinone oxidoreductase chain 5 n=1 Tax=Camellia lanceoleosa TaxID=1840588 RepID=A0ACC0GBG9_9ERIC|nr:NADH-ubiquinone oxidoreductase chain 5 [Camellia lanceoleosa]
MVVPSILAFFVLSYLLFLHSAGEDNTSFQNCPQSFQCGKLEQIKFPYSNITYPDCGLCTVNCSEPIPKLYFGVDQLWYEVHDKFLSHEVLNVTDKNLETIIKSKNCDVFTFYLSWSLPTTFVSFTVSPNLTFFKCPTGVSSDLDKQIDHFFCHNQSYSYYKGCSGYTVYYKYPDDPNQSLLINERILQSCVHFQLPVFSLNGSRTRNVSDLFSVLASEFSLGFHASNECGKCNLRGGHCPRYNSSKFQCIEQAYSPKKSIEQAKHGTKHVILILATAVAGIGILLILLFYITRKLAQNDQSTFFWKTKTKKYRNVEAFLKNYGSLAPKSHFIILAIEVIFSPPYTWSPDAMEGPTPVSALIHATTMVTAGVFMIARCSSLFEYPHIALILITFVGASTSFFVATTGI